MSLKVSQGESKPQGMKQPFTCILDSFNKFLKVLIDKLPYALPHFKEVDYKIEVVPRLALLFKAPYRLNQKNSEVRKKPLNDLLSLGYI
jgi:hypothetical protein